MNIDFEIKELVLKKTWKLSRNSSNTKSNIILRLNDSLSEIAPNIRYNESFEKAITEIKEFNQLISGVDNFDQAIEIIPKTFSHSTQFGLESLLLNEKCRQSNTSLCSELGIDNPKKIQTSFSLPIMEVEEIKEYLKLNNEYESYKIKVDEQTAIETVEMVASLTSKKLRIDANEGFSSVEKFLEFYEVIKELNIEFIEQPFKADKIDFYQKIKSQVKIPLIADESIESNVDFDLIESCFHGVNVKLMKAGGLKNAVRLLSEAKKRNLKTMIGCMIETSVGIKYAMILNSLGDYLDLDGHLLINNDIFDLIQKQKGELSIAPPYII